MRTLALMVMLLVAACSGSQPSVSPHPNAPGPLGDTWVKDGGAWRQVPVTGPMPRYFASLAYDAPRHDYVLFGGLSSKGPIGETWTWDGARWTQMRPAHSPLARYSAAMAYEPRQHVVLLYGGRVLDQAEASPGSDTRAWNGTDWTEVLSRNSQPGTRDGARMVTADGKVLLFGGRDGSNVYQGSAWTWSGSAWSRVDRGPTPQGRANAAVAWNPTDLSLFVYGGLGLRPDVGPGNLGLPLADAWSLQDAVWIQLKQSGRPVAANGNAIWDLKTRSVLVMFGIACPDPITSAWSWDGGTWAPADVKVTPRWGAALAQDPDGNVVVFGGSDEPGC